GDIAVCSGPVLDDEWLAEPLREPLTDKTPCDVDPAPRGVAHDDPHRPCRICLRPRDARHGRQRGSASGQMRKLSAGKFHGVRGLCEAPSIWPWLRGCAFHALADREAFAPQDLAALLITLDLVSHSGGRSLFSSGGQLSAVTQDLDVARGICHRSRSRGVARNRLDTTPRVKLDR